MTWIILQFVFLAMPVVLPALLYRSRRCFMARFYDKMVWSENFRRLYAHVLLIVLLLFHYVYTSGHPGEFGIVPSTIVLCRMDFRAGGPMDARLARPTETFRLVCALGIGHRLRAASVHDTVTIAFVLLAALFYPSARVMSEKDRHTQIPRMAGMSRSISRQLS